MKGLTSYFCLFVALGLWFFTFLVIEYYVRNHSPGMVPLTEKGLKLQKSTERKGTIPAIAQDRVQTIAKSQSPPILHRNGDPSVENLGSKHISENPVHPRPDTPVRINKTSLETSSKIHLNRKKQVNSPTIVHQSALELSNGTHSNLHKNQNMTLKAHSNQHTNIENKASSSNEIKELGKAHRPVSHKVISPINGSSDPCCTSDESYAITCDLNPYVKYWSDSHECFQSPLKLYRDEKKYVVFQTDLGGWNNIRMALEVVIVFAHVTGRILVIPPSAVLYLLARNSKWEDNKSSLSDFYDLDKISLGIDLISMEQFLREEGAAGNLAAPLPNNDTQLVKRPLWDYLAQACYHKRWTPSESFFGFNITYDPSGIPVLGEISPTDRLEEITLKRTLIPYDNEMHSHRAIFFSGEEPNRLLTHFYAYLYFADPALEQFYKRFVRDKLRYHDDIFCAAGRVLNLILTEASVIQQRQNQHHTQNASDTSLKSERPLDTRTGPTFAAYHIRRGEFQQKQTRISAEQILSNTLQYVDFNRTQLVYIATDEGNMSFFEPFRAVFKKVRFLSDYMSPAGLNQVNQNHIGMIEQVRMSE